MLPRRDEERIGSKGRYLSPANAKSNTTTVKKSTVKVAFPEWPWNEKQTLLITIVLISVLVLILFSPYLFGPNLFIFNDAGFSRSYYSRLVILYRSGYQLLSRIPASTFSMVDVAVWSGIDSLYDWLDTGISAGPQRHRLL